MKENSENSTTTSANTNLSSNSNNSFTKLKLQQQISSGLTSELFLALNELNEKVVVKIFNNASEYNFLNEKNYIEKSSTFNNIIQVYAYGKITTPYDKYCNHYYIVMEYAEKGDLVSLIEEKGNFSENEAKKIFLQLLSAVQTIHQNGFVHRDIKPENFLICKDQIKLTDFGFCEEIMNCSRDKNGTPGYIPPEILERDEIIIPEAIDVFSLGVVAFILVLGEFPFENPSRDDPCYTFISEEKWDKYWQSVNCEFVSKEFKDIFQAMVAEQPEKRPTIEEIKMCDWLKEVMIDNI